jgi:RNase P subunit RPR2
MGASDREVGDSPLGTCPNCETAIPRTNLLISYEAAGEWPRLFAECPCCGDPVHPE